MPTPAETHYEPRVLWDVAAGASSFGGPVRVAFNRNHLRHQDNCPLQLTHMLVTALDCTFEALDGTAFSDIHTASALYKASRQHLLSNLGINIMVPGRHFVSTEFASLASLGAVPTWGPDTAALGHKGIGFHTTQRTRGPLHNVCRWTFPKAVRLPQDESYIFHLSSYALPNWWSNTGVAATADIARAQIGFYEEFGDSDDWPGSFRTGPTFPLRTASRPPWPDLEGNDPLGTPFAGETEARWPPSTRFNPSVSGDARRMASKLRGFSVMIDQTMYDAEYITELGADTGYLIASLADKIATKAHFESNGKPWWREGAPLSLVCPSATPAVVVPFDQPLTLMPGDSFDVEALIPDISGQAQGKFNLGISFAGMLARERSR